MKSNRHSNPIRLIRNISRIFKLRENVKSSVTISSGRCKTDSSEEKKIYWLPCLKNSILAIIAITLSETFRINEIARCLPISSCDKQKQKRLLRFLDRGYPADENRRSFP